MFRKQLGSVCVSWACRRWRPSGTLGFHWPRLAVMRRRTIENTLPCNQTLLSSSFRKDKEHYSGPPEGCLLPPLQRGWSCLCLCQSDKEEDYDWTCSALTMTINAIFDNLSSSDPALVISKITSTKSPLQTFCLVLRVMMAEASRVA